MTNSSYVPDAELMEEYLAEFEAIETGAYGMDSIERLDYLAETMSDLGMTPEAVELLA